MGQEDAYLQLSNPTPRCEAAQLLVFCFSWCVLNVMLCGMKVSLSLQKSMELGISARKY